MENLGGIEDVKGMAGTQGIEGVMSYSLKMIGEEFNNLRSTRLFENVIR